MVTKSPFRILTEREEQVAALAAEGLFNKEIAARLYITENSVRAHMRFIFQKTDCRNRTEVALWWLQEQGKVSP